MLKDRLYYAQPNCKNFTANIKKLTQDENKNTYVLLDQTAFYPTGGGQPHDTGTIHGVQVINVEEVKGEIRHYIENPIDAKGEVTCSINWARRFDHMQQHAGQHILSAAFVELFDFPTVSFHLGTQIVSIDLETEEITEEQLNEAEKRANEIILENHPIDVKWVTEIDLADYPLRKKIQAEDEIRLVIIPNFDYNGCGGTHPEFTGQVSALKILDVEKHRHLTRVSFVCGHRVLDQLHRKTAVVKEASQLLSASEERIGAAIKKLLTTNRTLEKTVTEKEDAILQLEANELIAKEQSIFITKIFTNRSIQQLQKLARLIIAELENTTVFLIANNGDKTQFVAARGNSVEQSMKDLATIVLPMMNGKGGGSDAFMQGGGDQKCNVDDLIDAVKTNLFPS